MIGRGLVGSLLLVVAGAGAPAPAPSTAARCPLKPGAARIPAGVVLLGEDGPDVPGQSVRVKAFSVDRQEVTVAQFRAFVAATGYRTSAEREGGGAVFVPASSVSDTASSWWRWVEGARWSHPLGTSAPPAAEDEPVRQVTLKDAGAYAAWSGRNIPSETEWERAARGGDDLPKSPREWAYAADGEPRANTWQGHFPLADRGTDGFAGIAPVGCFEGNGFGVQDMIGNVWEWALASDGTAVIKGGSYLCSFNFCTNFKPASRIAQEADLPTSHIGFRTISRTSESASRRSTGFKRHRQVGEAAPILSD